MSLSPATVMTAKYFEPTIINDLVSQDLQPSEAQRCHLPGQVF
jgi:hypothetical protein